MIDTVILTIPRYKFTTLNSYANGLSWDLNARTPHFEKFVKNPSAADKNKGIYMPRLTGINMRITGGTKSFLKIEFSVPKLLYQNNLREVTDNDFPEIVSILQNKLRDMGVITSKSEIENAAVSAFHPSKNIVLSDGYTASLVIKELSKINLSKKLDLNKADFRNNGRSLQGYTQSHSIVFYDKIADLNQSKKRAIDRDQLPQQLSLFAEIKKRRLTLEILRMEIRLCRKQKLNLVMQSLGFAKNPTFKDVVKKDVCQKIVQFYWKTLIADENLFLFELTNKPSQLLKNILRKHQKMKLKQAIYFTGLNLLCKDDEGIRGLRENAYKSLPNHNWNRTCADIKMLNDISNKQNTHGWIKQIEDVITAFQPIKIQI